MVVTLRGASLNWIVRQHPTFFHPQTWYVNEEFAGRSYRADFDLTQGPAPAVAYAVAFVTALDADELKLMDEWVKTSDVDHNGDLVYLGKAAQYGGLQVHRKLSQEPV